MHYFGFSMRFTKLSTTFKALLATFLICAFAPSCESKQNMIMRKFTNLFAKAKEGAHNHPRWAKTAKYTGKMLLEIAVGIAGNAAYPGWKVK